MSTNGRRGAEERHVREELWEAAHEDVEAESAWVDEPLARRTMIPSERERTLGVIPAGEQEEPIEILPQPSPVPDRKPLGQRVRHFLAEYRPSRITAGLTAFPLMTIGIVNLIEALHSQGLGILVFYMREDLGFDIRFLLFMGSGIGIVQTILSPLIGYLADRWNRTRMAFVGAVGFGLSSLLTGFASTPLHLGLLRVFGGVIGSLNLPTHQPLLADYYPPESRGKVFAFGPLLAQVGIIAGPIVGGSIAQLWGWRPAFLGLGALGTLAGAGFLLLKEPVRGAMDRLSEGADTDTAQTPPPPPPGLVESWRACASIVSLRRLWYAEPFLAVGGTGLFIVILAFQVDVLKIPPALLGLFAAVNAGLGLIGLMIGGPLVDRLLAYKPGRVMTLLGIMLVFNVFAFLGMALIPFIPLVILLTFTVNFLNPILIPARATLESMVIPARIRAIGLQSKAPWHLLGQVLGLVTAVFVGGRDLQTVMLVFVPIFLVGAMLYLAAAGGVERDIRAAKAATLAEVESRESQERGRAKLLVCRDVDVHRRGVQILFGVDFDVEEGEIVALLGTNGAGKSTLLRAISGLTEASNGAIFMNGRDITHVPPYEIAARRVIQMPGGRGVFPTLSVEENLRAATWLSDEEPEALQSRMKRVTEELFPVLKQRIHQPAGNLSGGEQQMLALGQAFLMQPRLLMIDELSLGLAPSVIQQLLTILKEIRDTGTTIILVEQSVNLALTIADRAVFMEKGEVRFSGPTSELLARPDILRSVFLRSAVTGAALAPATRKEIGDAEATKTVALAARDISVSFGGIQALNQVTIEVSSGEIVGLIGPNGAGKTTLFDAISGFISPDTGSIVLAGKDATSLGPDERARLGLGRSFQDARLFPSMTVTDNLLVAMERHLEARSALFAGVWAPRVRRSEKKVVRRAEALIEVVGLEAFRDKLVGELSTGTRRLVDLACMMAEDPEVLLLDEPSSGIAQAEAEELGPVLERIRRERGCSLLVIEHDMRLITSVADRLVALHLGSLLAEGKPSDVVNDPSVVEAYLGEPEKQLVGAAARSRSPDGKDEDG